MLRFLQTSFLEAAVFLSTIHLDARRRSKWANQSTAMT
jgi:hypothetical protein